MTQPKLKRLVSALPYLALAASALGQDLRNTDEAYIHGGKRADQVMKGPLLLKGSKQGNYSRKVYLRFAMPKGVDFRSAMLRAPIWRKGLPRQPMNVRLYGLADGTAGDAPDGCSGSTLHT